MGAPLHVGPLSQVILLSDFIFYGALEGARFPVELRVACRMQKLFGTFGQTLELHLERSIGRSVCNCDIDALLALLGRAEIHPPVY